MYRQCLASRVVCLWPLDQVMEALVKGAERDDPERSTEFRGHRRYFVGKTTHT